MCLKSFRKEKKIPWPALNLQPFDLRSNTYIGRNSPCAHSSGPGTSLHQSELVNLEEASGLQLRELSTEVK